MRLLNFPGLCCWSGIKAPMGVSGVCLPWYWTCWVTAGLALTATSIKIFIKILLKTRFYEIFPYDIQLNK